MSFFEKGTTLIELTVVLLVLVALAGVVVPYVSGTGSMAMCQATDATMQAVKEAIMGGRGGAGFYGDTLGNYPKATKGTATADYNLKYLFTSLNSSWGSLTSYNPKTGLGWRGSYLMSATTNPYNVDADNDTDDLTDELNSTFGNSAFVDVAVVNGDSVVLDGWGRPLIIQIPTAGCSYGSADECARIVSAGSIPAREIQSNGFEVTLTDGDASTRGDDRVLFLKKSDPGKNIPCNEL